MKKDKARTAHTNTATTHLALLLLHFLGTLLLPHSRLGSLLLLHTLLGSLLLLALLDRNLHSACTQTNTSAHAQDTHNTKKARNKLTCVERL